jgi:hypothetical protein
MPFDPTKPANNSPNSSAEMRSQLTGLKVLIDGILTITAAQVVGVNTMPPGNPANVSLSVVGNTLHFTFVLPQGRAGPWARFPPLICATPSPAPATTPMA